MSLARDIADLGSSATRLDTVGSNVVTNGSMSVSQRGTSFTGLGADGESYNLDRFVTFASSTAGRATITQDADSPDGFANSLKVACTTADTSVAAGEIFVLQHRIEGQDLQRFAKGTSAAKEFAVSFYVKGNANATYVCELFDVDNTRHVAKTFSVTTGWTRVELTFPADTTGAFGDDNGRSLDLTIWLHAGSTYTGGTLPSTWAAKVNANRAVGATTSIFDSTARTFFITGLQLQETSVTDFEHRSFSDQLQACQRFFSKSYRYDKYAGDTSSLGWVQTEFHENNQGAGYREYYAFPFAVRMRATPSITIYDTAGNAGKCNYYISVGSGNTNKVLNVSSTNERTFGGYSDRATSIGGWACHYLADAEL